MNDFDKIKEECGVFGMYNPNGDDVAQYIYYGLSSLQHRGQESCGIAVSDTSGPKGNVDVYKGMGLVNEVFKESNLSSLKGNLGVGHVRYSTTGDSSLSNAQPLVLNYIKGTLALAHNGNLVNTEELRNELAMNGAIFQTTTDSEVIAYYIARERVHTASVEEAILKTAEKIKGAYGLVIASPRKLIGVRDPYGLKPLCLGKKDDSYIIASESCALTAIGAKFIRDIRPGEIVSITKDGISSNLELCHTKQAHCIFEYIYFARLDSTIDGVSVYESRLKAGAALAKAYPIDADLVAGVPDSGLAHAIGYSNYTKIPYTRPFIKYTPTWARSFMPTNQKQRNLVARMKLIPVHKMIKDRKLLLIDDSIVRGTQLRETTEFLYRNGAKEVHVRPACPPLLFGCKYLNFSRSKSVMDLITRRIIADFEGTENVSEEVLQQYADPDHPKYKAMVEEIRKQLNFTSLEFLRLDDMIEAIGIEPCKLCTYCWNGKED